MAAPDGYRDAFLSAGLVRRSLSDDGLPVPLVALGSGLNATFDYHNYGYLRIYRIHRQTIRHAGSYTVITDAGTIN